MRAVHRLPVGLNVIGGFLLVVQILFWITALSLNP
jgi:hypothetical protein